MAARRDGDDTRLGDRRMPRVLRHRRMPVRVLPLTLIAVAVTLFFKVGDVWQGFASLTQNIQVTTAQAQAQSPQTTPGATTPTTGDMAAKTEPGPGAKPGEAQVASTAPLPTAKLPSD